MTISDGVETHVDQVLTLHNTGPIQYYAYTAGAVDAYKQRVKTFASAVELVGRAIRRPTMETVTVIGDGEVFDLACVFSRKEMLRKFPTLDEGEWMDVTGEIEWLGRRYKIEAARPSGQVQTTFCLVIILCTSFPGVPG